MTCDLSLGSSADRPSLQVIIKWRGKPVFIRHRTQGEIDEANQIDHTSLRDPQPDEERVQDPKWLVMLGTLPPPTAIAFPSHAF